MAGCQILTGVSEYAPTGGVGGASATGGGAAGGSDGGGGGDVGVGGAAGGAGGGGFPPLGFVGDWMQPASASGTSIVGVAEHEDQFYIAGVHGNLALKRMLDPPLGSLAHIVKLDPSTGTVLLHDYVYGPSSGMKNVPTVELDVIGGMSTGIFLAGSVTAGIANYRGEMLGNDLTRTAFMLALGPDLDILGGSSEIGSDSGLVVSAAVTLPDTDTVLIAATANGRPLLTSQCNPVAPTGKHLMIAELSAGLGCLKAEYFNIATGDQIVVNDIAVFHNEIRVGGQLDGTISSPVVNLQTSTPSGFVLSLNRELELVETWSFEGGGINEVHAVALEEPGTAAMGTFLGELGGVIQSGGQRSVFLALRNARSEEEYFKIGSPNANQEAGDMLMMDVGENGSSRFAIIGAMGCRGTVTFGQRTLPNAAGNGADLCAFVLDIASGSWPFVSRWDNTSNKGPNSIAFGGSTFAITGSTNGPFQVGGLTMQGAPGGAGFVLGLRAEDP